MPGPVYAEPADGGARVLPQIGAALTTGRSKSGEGETKTDNTVYLSRGNPFWRKRSCLNLARL